MNKDEQPTAYPEAKEAGESQADAAEIRMRRALGLVNEKPVRDAIPAGPARQSVSPSGRPQRRFVQDGEVPVTVVRGRWTEAPGSHQPPTNRLAIAEAAAEAERTRRERTERSLQESVETIRDLQTKQAHIELARDEALQALKLSAGALESLHLALRSHQEQLAAMQAAVKEGERAVRASSAALAAEREARVAAETALREKDARQKSPGRKSAVRKAAKKPVRPAAKPKRRASARSRKSAPPARGKIKRRSTRVP